MADSTGRTFIVEDYADDAYGQWDTDSVTREQGYIDDERYGMSSSMRGVQKVH